MVASPIRKLTTPIRNITVDEMYSVPQKLVSPPLSLGYISAISRAAFCIADFLHETAFLFTWVRCMQERLPKSCTGNAMTMTMSEHHFAAQV